MPYQVIFERDLLHRAAAYAESLAANRTTPGAYLAIQLAQRAAPHSGSDILQALLQTKRAQIFAESEVAGDGRDWNATELRLLGDISIATEVEIYDDGRHHAPALHSPPFPGTLVFTCGALLTNGQGRSTPDLEAVTRGTQIDQADYNALYRRRLRPVFAWIQAQAQARGRNALVTIPGLGCGQFAGRFAGRIAQHLQQALETVLAEMSASTSFIKIVIFDPYNACEDHSVTFGATEFRVRPLLRSRNPHPQLCRPETYAESGDDFSDFDLYSLVAWDHVSWPGNDFYAGVRATDDGVKAAATSSMLAMTGISGSYDPETNLYQPPAGYEYWEHCVTRNALMLSLGNPFIYE